MFYKFTFRTDDDYVEAWEYLTKGLITFKYNREDCMVQFSSDDVDKEDEQTIHDRLCELNPAVVRWSREET